MGPGKVRNPLFTHSTVCFPPFHLQLQSDGQAPVNWIPNVNNRNKINIFSDGEEVDDDDDGDDEVLVLLFVPLLLPLLLTELYGNTAELY